MKRLVVLLTVSVLAWLGVASPALAAPAVSAPDVREGQPIVATLTGCDDPALYSGASVFLLDSAGNTLMEQGTTGSGTISFVAQPIGTYTVQVSCYAYGGAGTTRVSTSVRVIDGPTTPVTARGTYGFSAYPDKWRLNQQVAFLQATTPGDEGTFTVALPDGTLLFNSIYHMTDSGFDYTTNWTFDHPVVLLQLHSLTGDFCTYAVRCSDSRGSYWVQSPTPKASCATTGSTGGNGTTTSSGGHGTNSALPKTGDSGVAGLALGILASLVAAAAVARRRAV